MTTVGSHVSVCIVCGKSSTHTHINSTNSFGPPDLDLRPPPMQRQTIAYWLEECPGCGFVAPSTQEPDDEAKAAWQVGRVEPSAPFAALQGLARRFLVRSLLEERLGRIEAARFVSLHAAWAADDAGDALARELRGRAADLAAHATPSPGTDMEARAASQLDILRRAGRWREAVTVANRLLEQAELHPILRSVAAFGRDRAEAQDDKCYTVKDATERFPAHGG